MHFKCYSEDVYRALNRSKSGHYFGVRFCVHVSRFFESFGFEKLSHLVLTIIVGSMNKK